MKRLGAYISPHADTASSSPYFTKGCFVYYEYSPDFTNSEVFAQMPRIDIWRLDNTKINQQPDEVIFLKSPSELKEHIATYETWANHYISYHDQTYRIRNIAFRYARLADIEIIDELTVDAVDHYETLKHEDSSAYRFLKEAKLTDTVYKTSKISLNDLNHLVMPSAIDDMIKEELKKSLEKSVMNDALIMSSAYGMGGFTTRPVLSPEEIGKMFDRKNKETETMEKKMTQTDLFLKDLDSITITSTYSKLDHGFGKPYYIYYPEMEEITEDIVDTLLTVLLMAKRDYIHKVVFNPKKGTTTITKRFDDGVVTVRCKDSEFDYILGYEMARTKMYLGSDDYNWFNKIKNHRKTHIEYTEKPTEPKAKVPPIDSMSNDSISRRALINDKPEFLNEKVVRDTKYQTTKDRIYAKAWNDCNSYWLNTIINAPTKEEE